jgi:uracil-DNA glycosylase
LTDVIKSRGKVGEPYPNDIGPHKEVFDEEIDIVRPHCIIAFGQKAFDLLQFTLGGSDIRVYRVRHYAYASRGRRAAAAFEKTFRDVVAKCRRLNR